jgi:hypothetical protein
MINNSTPSARWENYVLEKGANLFEFWCHRLESGKGKILFIMGKGFDPRMCLGIERLFETNKSFEVTVKVIVFDEGTGSPSNNYSARVEENWQKLENIVNGKGSLLPHPLPMWSEDGRRRVGSRAATQIVTSSDDLKNYTDIIIDVSSMPRSIYMPLIASVLNCLDAAASTGAKPEQNLHVWVSENPFIDMNINDEEIDEQADFIQGFRGGFDMESTAGQPRVWMPILGEGQKTQLERINELLQPDEICPVLPSPSFNPRRGDNLVLEYREFLFDTLNVEPRNFIYAAERNPFEVYRQMRRTIVHYRDVLHPLGGCKTALSALSSKLMSLGTLLVAYELKSLEIEVGIAHIEANGYKINEGLYEPDKLSKNDLFGLWLFGECYEI